MITFWDTSIETNEDLFLLSKLGFVWPRGAGSTWGRLGSVNTLIRGNKTDSLIRDTGPASSKREDIQEACNRLGLRPGAAKFHGSI